MRYFRRSNTRGSGNYAFSAVTGVSAGFGGCRRYDVEDDAADDTSGPRRRRRNHTCGATVRVGLRTMTSAGCGASHSTASSTSWCVSKHRQRTICD
jgi:hypothetical protein